MSTYDPTDLDGQRRDKREADARKRQQRTQEIADFKWLMNTPRGRRILWRLLTMARVFNLSFNTNAMQMAFNEGNRNLGKPAAGRADEALSGAVLSDAKGAAG